MSANEVTRPRSHDYASDACMPSFSSVHFGHYVDLFEKAMAEARRATLEEVLKIARGTKEDGHSLAGKAEADGDKAMAVHWRGEADGAAEIERDIMNLLGIDWANGETEVRR